MATKVNKICVNQPFNEEIQTKAYYLIDAGRSLKGGIWTNRDATAQRCGYRNWRCVPEAVRKCVNQIGSAASIRAKALKKEINERVLRFRQPSLFQDNLHQARKQPKIMHPPSLEDWYKEVANSETLQHGLHPEDEKGLIAFFQEQ